MNKYYRKVKSEMRISTIRLFIENEMPRVIVRDMLHNRFGRHCILFSFIAMLVFSLTISESVVGEQTPQRRKEKSSRTTQEKENSS